MRKRLVLSPYKACRTQNPRLSATRTTILPHDRSAPASSAHHRRRPRRMRGGLAGRHARHSSRAARDASAAHDRGPQDRGTRRAGLLELVPLRRPGAQRGRPVARGNAPARLADHACRRPPPGAGRRRIGGRPRELCNGGDRRARRPSLGRDPARRGRGTAARRLGQRDHRHRPPHLPGARRGRREAYGRGRARLLRCHRSDRSPRDHRHVGRVAAVALRQGGAGRIGRRLHQLPAHARAIPRLRRRLARRRQGRLPRLGDALFRRLPADRGDGGARTRDACATAR